MIKRILVILFLLSPVAFAFEVEEAIEDIGGFVEGTMVQTPQGRVLIQAIHPGDHVLSFDHESGTVVEKKVLEAFRVKVNQVIEVIVNKEKIYANPDHRFWVASINNWVKAKNLMPGDTLFGFENKFLEIESVKPIQTHEDIFDFKIEDTENYFVGYQGILVHNWLFLIPFLIPIGQSIWAILSAATPGRSDSNFALLCSDFLI